MIAALLWDNCSNCWWPWEWLQWKTPQVCVPGISVLVSQLQSCFNISSALTGRTPQHLSLPWVWFCHHDSSTVTQRYWEQGKESFPTGQKEYIYIQPHAQALVAHNPGPALRSVFTAISVNTPGMCSVADFKTELQLPWKLQQPPTSKIPRLADKAEKVSGTKLATICSCDKV